jgi:hypothetical protein
LTLLIMDVPLILRASRIRVRYLPLHARLRSSGPEQYEKKSIISPIIDKG